MINYLNLLHQSTPEIQGKLRTLENLHLKKWSLIFNNVCLTVMLNSPISSLYLAIGKQFLHSKVFPGSRTASSLQLFYLLVLGWSLIFFILSKYYSVA